MIMKQLLFSIALLCLIVGLAVLLLALIPSNNAGSARPGLYCLVAHYPSVP